MKQVFATIFTAFILTLQCLAQTGPGTFVWTDGAPTHNPGTSGAKFAVEKATFEWYEWKTGTTWVKSGDRIQQISGCTAPAYVPGKNDSRIVINGCTSPTIPKLYQYVGPTVADWVCLNCAAGGGSGTVESFTFSDGNGFDGTVTNSTTTPTLSLATTATGILQGSGGAISAITVGGGLTFGGSTLAAVDQSTTNEIQSLSYSTPTVSLSNGGGSANLSDLNETVSAGTGISVNQVGQDFAVTNTAPDQTVTITGTTGTYPTFALPLIAVSEGYGIDIAGTTTRTISVDTAQVATPYDISQATQTVSAGTGISVSQTGQNYTVTNTGDLSATNELNTAFTVTGGNLRLTDAGGNLDVAVSSIAPVQAVAAGTGISISGTTTRTITNTAPDQTVSITGAGISAVTGTYPTFTITSTEIDGSVTNELQTLSVATNTATLSNSGGSVTIAGAGINTVATAGTTITVTGTEVDGSVTNEGRVGVGAGSATSSVITSNTSGATGVTINASTGLSISETTNANGGQITLTNSAPDQTVSITGAGINAVTGTYPNFTITGTEVDGSVTNEAQTLSVSGTSTGIISLNAISGTGGGTATIAGAGINTVSQSGGTITVTGTEVDGSTSNELQTVSFTSPNLSISSGNSADLSTLYSFSTGLANTSNTVTANLSTGVSGGQSAIGGTGSGENLTLQSTSDATKGKIFFGANSAYNQANDRFGINQTTPTATLHLLQQAIASVGSGSGTAASTLFTITGTTGGATSANSGTVFGGNGGGGTITGGAGGSTTGTPGTGFGGNGGSLVFTGGNGGSGQNFGGVGGHIEIAGGTGGFGAAAGAAGYASIKGGNAATSSNGSGGNVYVVPGIGDGSGAHGSIYLGLSPSLTQRGNVKIGGTTAPAELLALGEPGTKLGNMSFAGNTSGKVVVQPAAAAGTWTMTLPTDDGTTGQVLTTDGSGVTSWTTVSGGGGGTVTTDATLTGDGSGGDPLGIAFPILAPDGSLTAPSYSFANYPTAGLSMDAATTTLNTPAGTPMLINAEQGSEITIRTADRAEDAIVSPINIITGASTATGTGGGINITTGSGETGGQLAVTLGSAIGGTGGAFAMYGGSSSTGIGGGIVFNAGASTDGSGGQINITSGASTTGPGGNFQLQAGSSTSGLGGYFSQSAGNSTSSTGGYFNMTAGSSVEADGGYFSMVAGDGVTGGNFTMRSGDATGSNANAGNFNMSAGNNAVGLGGGFSLSSGSGIYGGNVIMTCGTSDADEDSGGSFVMESSTNTGIDGEGGQFYIRGGDAPNGTGGAINLDPGQGQNQKSAVLIGSQAIFKFGEFTTAQRDALSITGSGHVIFNVTTNKLQIYISGSWVDLH